MTSQSDLDVQRIAAARLWAATRFPYLVSALFATRLLPLHPARCGGCGRGVAVLHRPRPGEGLAAENLAFPAPPVLPSTLGCEPGRFAEEYFYSIEEARLECDCGSGCDGTPKPWDRPGGRGTARPESANLLRCQVAAETLKCCRSLMPGTVPVGLRRWAEGLLGAGADWRRVLSAEIRRGVAAVAGAVNYSYKRPSRRAVAVPDVVMPTMLRPVPEVAVVVDTSGSMSEQLLGRALSEVDGLLRSPGVCQRRLPVLPCDAAVHAVQNVTSARQVELLGGGGTNMGEGIEAACRLRPPQSVVVVLTDGFTPWPSEPPGGVRVIVGLLRKGPTRTPG